MDSNANLAEQEQIMANRNVYTRKMTRRELKEESQRRSDRLRELREALDGWLSGGGFAPDWSKCPNAARWYGRQS